MMFESLLFLQSYGFFRGGGIGELFNYWEQAGVFSYVLPFLLIFSIVFVVMNNLKLFEQNKAVSAVIAISVGLLAMQFDLVPFFFAELFPRVGVGLSIILAVLIITGLFLDPTQKWMKWGLLGVSVLILIAVLFDTTQFAYGYYLYYLLDPQILSWILFIVLIIVVAVAMSKKPMPNLPDFYPTLFFPQGRSRSHPEGPMG